MEVLNKFIVIEKVNEKKTSSSGLIMSDEDTSDMRYHKGIVKDVGFNVLGIKSETA